MLTFATTAPGAAPGLWDSDRVGVTRADVARAAGVSPAVVSYVLRPGLRPVAPETRERVLAAVERLGYRPNAVAQALRGGPTSSIGMLVPDHTNPFFAELASAVEDLAFARGYVLLMGSTADDEEREAAYVRTFVDRRVDALLVVAARSHPELAIAAGAGVPVVVLDRVPEGTGVSTVRTDGVSGAAVATRHLLDRGHAVIGAIAGPEHLTVTDDRLAGWRAALVEAGLPHGDDLVGHAPFTRAGGEDAALALLAARPDVTAVFVSSDVQAAGVLSACARLGRAVPRDLAVVAFDGTRIAPHTQPPLTVVQQPVEQIARLAVDRLLARTGGGPAEPTHDVLATELVVRGSS